jgi:NAD dependent epimerase/dehydratase
MTYAGKRVLVTGAGGFIGSHLVEGLIESGAEVTALVRYTSHAGTGHLAELPQQPRIVYGDVRDRNIVVDAVLEQHIVFHLAALIGIPYSYHAPESYLDVNLGGMFNVLDAARVNPDLERVVVTSTSETYGTAQYAPIDEKHPLQAQSPYSASKIAADKLAESYHLTYDLPVVTVRPFNNYGPRQSTRAIIPTIIAQLLDRPKELKLGSLTPTRDLLFVKDTVRGFMAAGLSDAAVGKTINLGTGIDVSMGNLAQEIMASMNHVVPIVEDETRVRPEKSEVHRLVADTKLAENVLSWTPKTVLADGLRETISYVRKNQHYYKDTRYAI